MEVMNVLTALIVLPDDGGECVWAVVIQAASCGLLGNNGGLF